MRIATTIFDNFEKKIVPASLIIGIDAGVIEEVGNQWKRERIRKVAHQGKIPQHFHWEWGNKASQVKGLLAYEFFAIECQGVIEGLMLTESVSHRAELPPDQGKPILYVEFIETAPSSTAILSDVPQYRDIGTRLIEGAANYSIDLGFDGRVGLSTLPQAERFYMKLGLEKVRWDIETQLYYYEWTAQAVKNHFRQRK